MRTPLRQTRLSVGPFVLVAAWVGAWGTWLAHPTAGLTQGALDMAQVAERLPDVLYGRLGNMPNLLRASLGMTCVALSLAANEVNARGIRWLLRTLALLMTLRLLPPYPYVLDLWHSPDYGGHFVIAALTMLGWAVALTGARWPDLWRQAVTLALALVALAAGLWAYLALRHSFVTSTQLPFSPGWGIVLYMVGLLTTSGLGLVTCLKFLRPNQAT